MVAIPQPVKSQLAEAAAVTVEQLLQRRGTSWQGLTVTASEARRAEYGFNEPGKPKRRTVWIQLLSKFLSPLVIVLLIIAGISVFFGEKISAFLVIGMAVISVFLSFLQEYRAGKEAAKLREMVLATATAVRDGQIREVKIRELVPGDLVNLAAGDMIPADLRIVSAKDLFLNQASLTGESFPIEKYPEPVAAKTITIQELANIAFMGSSVVSGSGQGVVVATGPSTQFGQIAEHLTGRRAETSFEAGIRRFTWLMIRVMLVMVVVIFFINLGLRGQAMEALLFSLGVAVGITPEMLPMLVAVNLSQGAIAMARKRVIVKHLNSIQNFGAMDILCADKTGTLTLDKVVLEKHCDVVRNENEDVLRYAHVNSYYQTGLRNVLDRAILEHERLQVPDLQKTDEIPFDFFRKIMSVVVQQREPENHRMLIAKGAPEEVFKRCTHYDVEGETLPFEPLVESDLREEYDKLSSEGFRVLAVAYKRVPETQHVFSKDDEKDLILKGYVAFLDPPKPTVREALVALRELGIECKILTGDHELVTRKICSDVGLEIRGMATGDQVEKTSDASLRELAKSVTIFARMAPLQKERVIRALRANGRTVGYMGDGINDAPALKAADVGISVNNAVDIAKESADLILLEKNLLVLADGVLEGRKTFGNIIKYIRMGASSNFGNMLSMTGGSLFLPFIPMLPIQILLNNFLYDLSQTAIPTDAVDPEYVKQPKPWDIRQIRNFMLVFGPASSLFDFLTFGLLLAVFQANAAVFHTGWFIESLCTQTLVIHVIRTFKVPFAQSRASGYLIATSLVIAAAGVLLPLSPWRQELGFAAMPTGYWSTLAAIVAGYLLLVQTVKIWFVKKLGY